MKYRVLSVAILLSLVAVVSVVTQQRQAGLPTVASAQVGDAITRIKAEGLQRSRVLALYRTITDEFGARLTGSPAHKQAANWAVERLKEFGLANPHLEPYEFGHGWQVDGISVEMTQPGYQR